MVRHAESRARGRIHRKQGAPANGDQVECRRLEREIARPVSQRAGAHAGFTLRELGSELRAVFNQIDDATLDYYLAMYPHRARTVRLLHGSGLGTFAFPSIYFVGRKT